MTTKTAAVALNNANLSAIAATTFDGLAVDVPRYERRISQRICHIGVGGFHRAHQAHYLHRLLQQGLGDGWGICGIALRAADRPLFEALQHQDLLYSLWEVDAQSRRVSVIGSLMACVDASADSALAVNVLADAATKIVSLTITEAGYCLDASGELDATHADIASDIASFASNGQLRSAQGVIVKALALRRDAGLAGFTLMSCDNLIENGHRLRHSMLGFARHVDAALAQWIESHVSFPSSMVDRITPVADRPRNEQLCSEWGVADRALVLCEPWQQWILEDAFVAGRPAFEQAGVVLTAQVKLFEDMKVGLLNGGHSALSHVGLLSGHSKVHEALAQPLIAGWLCLYMREIAATLTPVPGIGFDGYEASLLQRFLNPAIEDRLQRLAQDSSSKFLQVLRPPLMKRLARGESFDAIAATLALWMLYLDGLSRDAAARDAYLDAAKDQLISLAVAAVASGNAGAFLDQTMSLPVEHASAVRARVDHHAHAFRGAGLETHLRQIGAAG
jgi:mannitol 2-dehydrogenase